MNGSGCKNCPVKPCETMNYRGSTCAAQRAKFGLGDPQTNADRIRAMSDEELANVIALLIEKDECFREDFADCQKCPLYSFCSDCKPGIELEWLKNLADG